MKKKKYSDDKPSLSAKSKSRKESKVQNLVSGLGEAQKGMIKMASKVQELRGLPAAFQTTFDQQLSEAKGANPAPGLLLTGNCRKHIYKK